MPPCVTTRFRPATDFHSAYAGLCRESDPRKTRYALSLHVYPVSASSGRPSPATFFPFRAQSAASAPRKIHSIPIHPPPR
jgi:hypothetical protein